jgi:hypothetical protein
MRSEFFAATLSTKAGVYDEVGLDAERPLRGEKRRSTCKLFGVAEGTTGLIGKKSHPGTVRNFVCGQRFEHQAAMARVKRSPKMMANCALAMTHSRGPIFHAFSDRFKTR